jgi:hypothetical protein
MNERSHVDHHHHVGREVAAYALPLLRGERTPPVAPAAAAGLAEGLRRAGLTALALSGLAGGGTEPALLRALEAERSRLRADLALLYDRLGRFAATLDGAGVPWILLKGAALAPLLYESADLRPMVDVDILIRRGSWPAARAALAGAGYRLPGEAAEAYWLANYFNMTVGAPGATSASFDIHWGISQQVRYTVDEEGLWRRAVRFRREGREHLRLGDEDLLLSLILHLAYHYFDARLLWLYDVHLLCRRVPIDWEEASRRARAWGMATVYGLGLAYVEKVFPGSIPSAALRAARPGPLRRALLAPLRSPEPDRLFRGDDRRILQLAQGILVMDRPGTAVRFAAGKVARRLRFLGRRPRLR